MNLCETERCTGCAACANVCPKQCIRMTADAEGFLRPVADMEYCAACGACQEVCPILHPKTCDREAVAYAAIHRDESIRRESTSGGVFSLLCQWVFDHGGVVFGAAYAEDFSVEHRCVHSLDELSILRSAKYAQSQIGDSFQKVRQLLTDGRFVLFSGTPCQVGGLQAFLGKEYDRLILVDLICHGVPSPAVWSRYIDYRRENDASGAALASVNLRSKETGWPGYSVHFEYESGDSYSVRNSVDPYLRAFVGNLSLRPSCYACQFKGTSRSSDFTLGDYWGVWSQLPEYNDGKGTSIVLVHTEKAAVIWAELCGKLCYKPVETATALSENPSALYSPSEPAEREEFMSEYKNQDFYHLVDQFCPIPIPEKMPLWKRAQYKLRHLIKH